MAGSEQMFDVCSAARSLDSRILFIACIIEGDYTLVRIVQAPYGLGRGDHVHQQLA